LTNGTMDAVLLRGGGHVAELRLTKPAGDATNCLWPAPWQTADPGSADFDRLANEYGGAPAGNFLAGYTGHALCLDVFGAPTDEEAARGVPLHGEAAARMWSFDTADNRCTARVDLPAAQLEFERITSLAEETAVLFFHERVHNPGSAAREIHWVQHLSLGPPFLAPGQSAIDASLDRARTWPLGYEGHAVLRDDANFGWPLAPALDDSRLDLRIPFARSGYGFVAAARVDLRREFAFISALNWQLGLALVYCFRRADFPWIAIWEESRARTSAPWNGAAQVRGMEFGTTPMPVGRDAIRAMGNLFDTPGSRVIAAGETLEARYLAAIAHVPSEWRAITHVVPDRDALILTGPRNSEPVILAANGLQNFLQEGHGER
jgi:hypothetical protein